MEGYPAVGAVIAGRYRIESLLGEGGMGAVFRATETIAGGSSRAVAIKFTAAEMRNRPGIASRFANEAVAASKIESEHVVQILGVEATDDGTPFIVMELLEGRDLDMIIEAEAPLPADRAIHFALQILRALQVAHGVGVIHRDLKPSNCFVINHDGEPDWIKLIDFGIGKILGDEASQLTKTSTTLGTPAYMSPEQAKSAKSADGRSDLYSVGVILYELLTKKRPFDGDSHNEIVVKICTEPPVPLRSYRSDLPSKLVAAVEHALVKSPTGRYGSAIEFALALAPLAGPRSAQVLARIQGTSSSLPVHGLPQSPAKAGATAFMIADAPPTPAAPAVRSASKGSTAGMDDLAHSSTAPQIARPMQPAAPAAPAMPAARGEEKTLLGDVGPMTFGNAVGPVGGVGAVGGVGSVGAPRNVTEQALPIAAVAVAGPPAAYVPPFAPGPYSEDEPESRRGGSTGLMAVLGVLALGLIGSGIYYAVESSSSKAAPGSTVEPDDTSSDEAPDDTTAAKKKKKTPTSTSTKGAATSDDDDDTPPPTNVIATAKPTTTVKPKPTTTSTKPTSTTTTPTGAPTTTATTPPTTTTTATPKPTTTPTTTPTGFPFPFPFPSATTPPPATTTAPPATTTAPTIIALPTSTPTSTPTTTAGPTSTATTPVGVPTFTGPKKPKIGGGK